MRRGKIVKKVYYRIIFRLASALLVGSGENQYSDSDLLRDGAGVPYIPGSSLAGIYRSLLRTDEAERYFGHFRVPEQNMESKVSVYDAKIRDVDGKFPYRSVIRECVELDEWKTAKPGRKFELEVVEPGALFVTYLEMNWEEGDRDICEVLAAAWMGGRIRIGRKTMRGLGCIGETKVCRRVFSLEEREGLDAWLDFDMYREEDWADTELTEQDVPQWEDVEKTIVLEMDLQQRGGIFVRRYTTAVREGGVQPDAEQITCIMPEDGEEVPFIPGTSWAGAFRHHMERLIPGCTEDYFGNRERRSAVRFEESVLEGAQTKVFIRNAVDRFAGGVIKNALFTEKIWYGGRTKLRVEIPVEASASMKQALAAALVDLHMGILAVGGLTAAGRGIFEGISLRIDRETVPVDERMYGEILERLERR